jgi:hypothetical protein
LLVFVVAVFAVFVDLCVVFVDLYVVVVGVSFPLLRTDGGAADGGDWFGAGMDDADDGGDWGAPLEAHGPTTGAAMASGGRNVAQHGQVFCFIDLGLHAFVFYAFFCCSRVHVCM